MKKVSISVGIAPLRASAPIRFRASTIYLNVLYHTSDCKYLVDFKCAGVKTVDDSFSFDDGDIALAILGVHDFYSLVAYNLCVFHNPRIPIIRWKRKYPVAHPAVIAIQLLFLFRFILSCFFLMKSRIFESFNLLSKCWCYKCTTLFCIMQICVAVLTSFNKELTKLICILLIISRG